MAKAGGVFVRSDVVGVGVGRSDVVGVGVGFVSGVGRSSNAVSSGLLFDEKTKNYSIYKINLFNFRYLNKQS